MLALCFLRIRNHLSLEGIEFLEESLQEPSLTVICISHDRYFVDVFAKQIWELDGELHAYGPGYATFLDMKAQRIEAEEKEREDLLRTYKKELAWMRKQPKARGTKAKSREDNFRAMEEKLSRPKRSSGIQSLTATSTRLGGKAIGLKYVATCGPESDVKFERFGEACVRLTIPSGSFSFSCVQKRHS